jgi:hypothetical protein
VPHDDDDDDGGGGNIIKRFNVDKFVAAANYGCVIVGRS